MPRPLFWKLWHCSNRSSLLVRIAPPSPELRFFEAWKLKQPRSPSVLTFGPATRPDAAWQASSTTGSLCLAATARIASMSAAEPPRCTGMMHARLLGDRRLDLAGVDLEGLGIGVDEDRQRVVHQDGVDRGDERIRRHDDLVAGPDPQRGQRRDQRARAVGDGHAVLGAQHPRPGLLEAVGVVAVEPAPLPLAEDLHPGLLVVLGDDRPGGEPLVADRLAAQDGQRLVGSRRRGVASASPTAAAAADIAPRKLRREWGMRMGFDLASGASAFDGIQMICRIGSAPSTPTSFWSRPP